MSHIDINLILILLIAAMNAYTAFTSHRTNTSMGLLERNTNSIKDALVAATAKASLAEGTAAGLLQGHADGLLQGRGESDASRADPRTK